MSCWRESTFQSGSKDDDLIKRVSFIKRRPGMSPEEFSRYWREVHGPLALDLPGMRRYVQCHVVPSAISL